MTISRLAFLMVAAAGAAAAAGFQAEITVPGFSSPCPVESYSWGITQVKGVTVTGSAVSSKPQSGTLTVARQVDRCSPKFYEFCATGTHLTTVTLTLYDSTGRTELMQAKLSNVLIESVQHGANTSSPTPTEYVTFSFAKIQSVYYSSTGPVDVSFDLTSDAGF